MPWGLSPLFSLLFVKKPPLFLSPGWVGGHTLHMWQEGLGSFLSIGELTGPASNQALLSFFAFGLPFGFLLLGLVAFTWSDWEGEEEVGLGRGSPMAWPWPCGRVSGTQVPRSLGSAPRQGRRCAAPEQGRGWCCFSRGRVSSCGFHASFLVNVDHQECCFLPLLVLCPCEHI